MAKKVLTQNEKIIAYMKSHKGITTMTAFEKFGVTRLPSRICEIRKSGVNVISERVNVKNRFGETCNVCLYSVVK